MLQSLYGHNAAGNSSLKEDGRLVEPLLYGANNSADSSIPGASIRRF